MLIKKEANMPVNFIVEDLNKFVVEYLVNYGNLCVKYGAIIKDNNVVVLDGNSIEVEQQLIEHIKLIANNIMASIEQAT